jgi:hypothetical protein
MIPEQAIDDQLNDDVGWCYMKNDYISGGFTSKTELNGPYIKSGVNFLILNCFVRGTT